MNSFAILSGSLTESTLWGESNETRILFITMLTRCNRDGIVYSTVFGLSHLARLPIEDTEKSLAILVRPDTKNPQQDYEGRRIEKVEDGWQVLNHRKFIEKAKALTVRAYKTKWAREDRHAKKEYRVKSGSTLAEKLAVKAEQDGGTTEHAAESHE